MCVCVCVCWGRLGKHSPDFFLGGGTVGGGLDLGPAVGGGLVFFSARARAPAPEWGVAGADVDSARADLDRRVWLGFFWTLALQGEKFLVSTPIVMNKQSGTATDKSVSLVVDVYTS